MALTTEQIISLGFKPSLRGRGGLAKNRKYDSLVFPINETDFLYTGYNPFKKQVNYKTIWKSFKDKVNGERITYQVVSLADTGYMELKAYLQRTLRLESLSHMEEFYESVKDNAEFQLTIAHTCEDYVGIQQPDDTGVHEEPVSDEVVELVSVAPEING